MATKFETLCDSLYSNNETLFLRYGEYFFVHGDVLTPLSTLFSGKEQDHARVRKYA